MRWALTGACLAGLLFAIGSAPAQAENLPDPQATITVADPETALAAWVGLVRPRALAQGLTPSLVDSALGGVEWLPRVVELDQRQNEFTKTIWEYLDTAVSADRIAAGQRALDRHGALLEEIEARYGVDRYIVTAIWGLESAYGAVRGDMPTLSALATLGAEGRRGPFFTEQFLIALQILDGGHVAPGDMVGSWAGAMGHVQFLPGSWRDYAQDWDGDGRRDIWGDDPADALASAAAYLSGHGWTAGQPWGQEVLLPEGFDYTLARYEHYRSIADWTAQGVTDIAGNPLVDHGPAMVLLPGGADGAAFVIFENFTVIEAYNSADAYVVAVGHLADRLRGGPPIQADWPRGERALTLEERLELQRLLTGAGFDTQGVDGRIGPLTIAAIRGWQRAHDLRPDGFPSLSLLEALR